MIRWACCGLVLLLAGAVVGVRAESCALIRRKAPPPMKPNPFGGAPVPLPALKLQPVPGLPALPPQAGPNARPIRPVFTLPGPPKLDRHGDPLPSGAVVRFGTVRLRHGAIEGVAFAPDGKLLCTVSGSEDNIKMWDTVSGKEVARLPVAPRLVKLTKDGSVFVATDDRIRVWLPATNTVRELPEITISAESAPTAMTVHPDGRSLALAVDGKVLILDSQSGKKLSELALPGPPPQNNGAAKLAGVPAPKQNAGPPTPPPNRLMYSPDGRWLVGNGQKTGVWLWDLRTGKRVRTYRTEHDFPGYDFSPDVTKIVVTGQRLHLYSLDSEELVDGFHGPENVELFSPRFSADGKALFVMQSNSSVLQLDAATGEEKEAFEPPVVNLHAPFTLAPNGSRAAAVDESGGVRVWDPKTGKGPEVDRLPMLRHPGLSADGKSATVLDRTNKVHTFDLATGAPGKVIELPADASGIPAVWDPASRRSAATVPSGEALEVHVTDADTGKVVSKFPVPQNADEGIPIVSFAPGNRDRMVLFTQTAVVVVNPTNGKTVRSFSPGAGDNGLHGAISPDGRLVAVQTQPLAVWEVATGKKRLTVDAVQNVGAIAFSPDARFLATWDADGTAVAVVDVRTGTVVRRLQSADAHDNMGALALSADGKRLATGTGTGRVTVWDVASGEVLAPFAGHYGLVTGLVFTADGKKRGSTSQDGTALVWAVPDKPGAAVPAAVAVDGFDEAFKLLGSPDAAQAQRGLDHLYKYPAEAVKQAKERLPVPVPAPPAKLAQYVEDLGSEEFATREAALKALEKLGGEAGPVLRQALEKSPSAQVRAAATELLGKIDAPVSRAEDFRILRAVEALENLRSTESREQLKKWAAGPPGHRLTVEAAAALARLKALGWK